MDAIAIIEASRAIMTMAQKIRQEVMLPGVSPEVLKLTDQIIFQADCILNWYLTVDKQSETSPRI